MNRSVAHYISELLFLHDCVIIPEFGGFVGNRKPAQLNKTTNILTPPSKQILFNTNLKTNDGLLITHIANEEGITQKSAKQNVTDFVNKSKTALSNSKILRIAKIGLFTIGKEGNIIFSQDSLTNYSLESFGMESTYKKTLVREIPIEKKASGKTRKIRTKRRKSNTLLRAAAVMIPLIALSYLSISQQEKINTVYTQIATLNPFATTEISKTPIKITTPKAISEKATVAIKKRKKGKRKKGKRKKGKRTPIIKKTEVAVNTSKKPYYIIAGAFTQQNNANKMLQKLTQNNYNAEIIEGEKLLRVSYDSFYNKEEAILALTKIKQENPEAWLLTK